ncbi:putative transposase of IS4/5 family DUF4096 [Ochrobactrum sp. BH3]|nr:putative transposase of IS4/5 family DUF4096 [Ochrobactrum sp. BH3]
MAWTATAQQQYAQRNARDSMDAEWTVIEPMMPAPSRLGHPRKTDLCEVVNALLYIASSGGAWRLLHTDFAPFSTVQKYFYRWRDELMLA